MHVCPEGSICNLVMTTATNLPGLVCQKCYWSTSYTMFKGSQNPSIFCAPRSFSKNIERSEEDTFWIDGANAVAVVVRMESKLHHGWI